MPDGEAVTNVAKTAPSSRSSLPRWARAVSGAAAVWAVAFSAVHVYWLAGGTLGLPGGMSVVDNVPLLIIDVIAVPACMVAAWLAWLLPGRGPRRVSRRMRLGAGWLVTAVLLGHSLPTVPDWARVLFTSARLSDLPLMERFTVGLYEPWFLVGGLLFLAATLLAARLLSPNGDSDGRHDAPGAKASN
jgi:uncharacterized protein DUF3995